MVLFDVIKSTTWQPSYGSNFRWNCPSCISCRDTWHKMEYWWNTGPRLTTFFWMLFCFCETPTECPQSLWPFTTTRPSARSSAHFLERSVEASSGHDPLLGCDLLFWTRWTCTYCLPTHCCTPWSCYLTCLWLITPKWGQFQFSWCCRVIMSQKAFVFELKEQITWHGNAVVS